MRGFLQQIPEIVTRYFTIAENLGHKAGADVLASMHGYNRASAVRMTGEMMASPDADCKAHSIEDGREFVEFEVPVRSASQKSIEQFGEVAHPKEMPRAILHASRARRKLLNRTSTQFSPNSL